MTTNLIASKSRVRGLGLCIVPTVLLWSCSADSGKSHVVAGSHAAGSSAAGKAGTSATPQASGAGGVATPPNVGAAGMRSVPAQAQAGTGVGGNSGATGTTGAAGTAGAAGSAGTASAAGSGGTTGPGPYPALAAAMIGAPKRVAMGYTLAEGPVWDHCGHRLLFTDVEASTIHQLGADGKVSVFAMNTNYTNGIAFDIDGSLIMAQMGGSNGRGALARRDTTGMVSVLADKDPQGLPLHTVDDVVVGSDGTIYFSDGDFAHGTTYTSLGFASQLPVYALKPGSGVRTLLKGDTVAGPNGIKLSPDEKTLYVDGFGEGTVWTFSLAADGTPKKGTALTRGLSNPDSLCLDAAGNLYVGVSSGLQVLRPDGSKVSVIPISSANGVTNCTFGGDDGKTLYITAWTGLWKVDAMPIPGQDWTVNQTRVKCP
jgi:gluconolactonase